MFIKICIHTFSQDIRHPSSRWSLYIISAIFRLLPLIIQVWGWDIYTRLSSHLDEWASAGRGLSSAWRPLHILGKGTDGWCGAVYSNKRIKNLFIKMHEHNKVKWFNHKPLLDKNKFKFHTQEYYKINMSSHGRKEKKTCLKSKVSYHTNLIK